LCCYSGDEEMHKTRLLILAALAVASLIAFMSIGLRGNIAFALELRTVRLAALIVVAASIAVSTVLFQTVTGNRILTPSIMGLDALYVFGQIALVFAIGGAGFSALNAEAKFGTEVLLLMLMSCALLFPMLKTRTDIGLMLLAGVVAGILFRSLSSLLARLIDPNEFAVAQTVSFANFSNVETGLLGIAAVLTLAAVIAAWRLRHVLDVLLLGRESATGLGIDWLKTVAAILLLVSALVSVSTALVGPVAFLGLLVTALAEKIGGSSRHGALIPTAILVAIILLVGGQTLLQHVLGSASTLGIVIEFAGGLVFLLMLIAGSRK
jgi:iron complex transport system permease protein